jgi:hypothetical protein
MKKIPLLLSGICISVMMHAQTAASYYFNASEEVYNSIQQTGTAASIAGDDMFDTSIPIGFTFGYCGANYTQLYASSNGYISLPNVLPSSGAPSAANNLSSVQMLTFGTGLLCPFWDDLDGTGRNAFYTTLGEEPYRVFVFEWVEFGLYGGLSGATDDTLNFQVKLYETSGKIQFCYGPHNQPALSGTIGIVNSTTDFQTLDTPSSSPSSTNYSFTTYINSLPVDGQVYTWTIGPLGIDEPITIDITAFPNPSNGATNFIASSIIDSALIYTITGQQLASLNPMSNQFTYSFESSGCYYVELVCDKKRETIRVVIE